MSSILSRPLSRLVRKSTALPKGHRRADIIAVCARKGGVGKTTTAVNLAAGAAMFHGRKVLLVDMDAQGHCASALHSELRGVVSDTLSGVLLGKRRDVHEISLSTRIPDLWITPSDKDLGETEGVMSGRIGKEFLLRGALNVARTHYDLIVIDCPPNLGSLTINALMAADQVLVPCDMSVLALEGVDDIFETLDAIEETLGRTLGIAGVLRTRVDARNVKVNERVDAALRSRYGRHLLDTTIPINTRLSQAQVEGTPVFRYDASCSGSKAYRDLLAELGPRLRLR